MPIDARVPMAALANPQQPIDLLGMAGQAQLIHARQQQMAELERQRRDEQAQRQIWQESEGDPERAVKMFRERGYGDAAQKVETHIADIRSKRTKELKDYLDNQKATFEIVRGLTGAVTSESTHRLALDIARKMNPQFVPMLGETYDEAKIAALQQWGLDQQARVDLEAKTLDALSKGVKAPEEAIGLAAGLLKTAANPEQYQEYYAGLTELMPGPLRGQVMGLFQPNYSPEAVAAAERIAGATAQGSKEPASDYGRFETDFLKSSAEKIGKSVEQLTPAERVKFKTEARKQFGRADDAAIRPLAPIVIQTGAGPQLLDRGTGTARAITGADGQTVGLAPTAEMRNREAATGKAFESVKAVRALGDKLITKVGPAQRAQAVARGAAAVFGNDPEFRAYQDARKALAGNLAVMQQGSRPSDADIMQIWLPLVPDVYRDTKESADIKWRLIEVGSGFNQAGASQGIPAGTDVTVERWERGPDGKPRKVR